VNNKSDIIFDYRLTLVGNEHEAILKCGATFDYCTDDGTTACLTFVHLAGWDLISMMDDGLHEDIEAYAIEEEFRRAAAKAGVRVTKDPVTQAHQYELQEKLTNLSMNGEVK
jgi:hypothetical protein